MTEFVCSRGSGGRGLPGIRGALIDLTCDRLGDTPDGFSTLMDASDDSDGDEGLVLTGASPCHSIGSKPTTAAAMTAVVATGSQP